MCDFLKTARRDGEKERRRNLRDEEREMGERVTKALVRKERLCGYVGRVAPRQAWKACAPDSMGLIELEARLTKRH